jgi:hypothetical protein
MVSVQKFLYTMMASCKQFFEQKTVRGYLSSNDPVVHFGLGKTANVDSIVVKWLDGKVNVLKNITANQVLKASHKEAVNGINENSHYQPAFAETTSQILSTPFIHAENKYDEYVDQVLLPHEFSRDGPFIAKGDVNGDGNEDFYVGGAKDQAGCLYLQQNEKFLKKVCTCI